MRPVPISRRHVAALLVAAPAGLAASARAQGQPVKWSTGTERPDPLPPPGACDSHIHIYDSRFPTDPKALVFSEDATVTDYASLRARLGTSRCVVVHASAYGTDNRWTLDALRQLGPSARGIAVVEPTVPAVELRAMADAGVRGIRVNLVKSGIMTPAMLEPLSARVNDVGMHLQVHMKGDDIVEQKDLLARLPSVLVFDHMGQIPQPAGVAHPGFAVLRGLLDKGRTWVKLSGAYLSSAVGAPTYADTDGVARGLVVAAPQCLVWGSDWPHPTSQGVKPDDAVLLDMLARWVPDAAARHIILVENPVALYGFT